MAEKARILLADHHPAVRSEFSHILTSAGFEVEQADTADRFLAATRTNHHDVVLIDEDLPDLDCGDACRKLFHRSGPGLRRPAILVLKPRERTRDRTEIRRFSDGTLPYPCPDTALIDAVSTMVKAREEKKTRLENDLYRQVVRQLPEGIWAIDQEGRTTFMNECMADMLGTTAEETFGRPLFDFMDEQGIEICKRNMKRRENGISENHEFEFVREDGSRLHTLMLASPLHDAEGNYVGAVAGVADITDRKVVEESLLEEHRKLSARVEKRTMQVENINAELRVEIDERTKAEDLFRAVLESAPDAMVVADGDGRIILVNAVTEKMFGYDREELLGQRTEFLVPPHIKQAHIDFRERYRRNPRVTSLGRGIELEGQRKDGSIFPAEISLGPVRTGGGLLIVCAISDLTRRRARQKELEDNLNAQKVIGSILRLSLEPLEMDAFLQQTLQLILDLPWLAVQKRGAIFVVEDESDVLVMKAQHQLSSALLVQCDRVHFGSCLCGRAAQTRETVFAEDVDHRHETVYDGIEPHGHYCVPIVTDDRLYGVINLYLQQGHQATPHEKRFLALVADALAGAIRSKQTEIDLAGKEAQLLAAQSIQEHILPAAPPSVPGIEISGSYQPAEFAAGDHYDHFLLKDGSLAIGVGDVSGHGFSSALLMASTHAYIHALASMDQSLARVFDMANENLHHETDAGQFITAFLGRIDPATRELTYVSAGHPHGYVLDPEGEVRETLESTGLPLAVIPGVEYEEGPPVTLFPGDKVLLLTDGILEAESPSGEFFDEEGVLEAMRRTAGFDAQETVDTLMNAVKRFGGSRRQEDDLTAVVIRIVE